MAAVSVLQANNSLTYNSLNWQPTIAKQRQDRAGTGDVPDGFPSRYTGERVWTGAEMADRQDEWIIQLSEQDLNFVHEALHHFQSKP